ncbi:MAG: hypothetical protein ABII06_12020 [Pseudomonadota bacterium]
MSGDFVKESFLRSIENEGYYCMYSASQIQAVVSDLRHYQRENAELRRRAVKAESNVRRSCGVIGRLVGFLECPSLKTLAEDYLADMKRDWPSPRAEEEGE